MDVSLYVWFAWQTENFSNLFLFSSWLKDCKYAISSWSRSKSRKCQLSSSSIERHMMLQAKTERQKHLPTRMKVAKSLFKHSINLFHEINIVSSSWNEESTIKTAVCFCNKALCGSALLHCQGTFWIQSLLEFITYIPLCSIWPYHSNTINFPRIHVQKGAMHHCILEHISLLD